MTPQQKWDFVTQWSFPKIETVRLLIPGLYGYGMPSMYNIAPDQYGGKEYWGRVGETPGTSDTRLSGAGEYPGILVILLAIFALAQALRKNQGLFNEFDRRCIWFWCGAAIVSLLFAFGRHAPFYQIIYQLPFFNNIRNPIKFTHPLHLSLLILSAYGLNAICRKYLEAPAPKLAGVLEQVKAWWKTARGFEKTWALGSLAAVAAAWLGWLMYASTRSELVAHLKKVMTGYPDPLIEQMARFSVGEFGMFAVFLALGVGLMIVVLSGALAGGRAKWAGLALGAFIFVDLARANAPWIIYYDYQEKYTSNPVIDILREKPHEQRVVFPLFDIPGVYQGFHGFYFGVWLQHHFPYYNIQSFDVSQDARPGADKVRFSAAFHPRSRFSAGEIKDPAALVAKLQDPADPLSQHLLAGFSESTRRLLAANNGPIGDVPTVTRTLAQELNLVLEKGPLYEPARFARVDLSPETKELLARSPAGAELAALNRQLLASAYRPGLDAKQGGEIMTRYWELTNTRLVLGLAGGFADSFYNRAFDPLERRFRQHTTFNLVQSRPGGAISAELKPEGQFSIMEFTGALPRVKLYSQWEIPADDDAALRRLTEPLFVPAQTVLVSSPVPAPATGASTNAGTVEITRYAPKHLEISAKPNIASVMLLNDRYSVDWKALVDGKSTEVLRCNYIMQGIYLTPGEHKIELRFEPRANGLYVTLAAMVIGLGLCGLVLMAKPKPEPAAEAKPAGEKPKRAK
jgi:hypothetical protein